MWEPAISSGLITATCKNLDEKFLNESRPRGKSMNSKMRNVPANVDEIEQIKIKVVLKFNMEIFKESLQKKIYSYQNFKTIRIIDLHD